MYSVRINFTWLSITLGMVLLIFGCSQKRLHRTTIEPTPVLTIDHQKKIIPARFSTSSEELISQFSPTDVSITANIDLYPDSDNSFVLTLAWDFIGPEPDHWSINIYSGLKEQHSDELSFLGGHIIQTNEKREFISSVLEKGLVYEFILSSHVVKLLTNQVVEGEIVFKTIRVDLRDLP